jgi:hypothetical protein
MNGILEQRTDVSVEVMGFADLGKLAHRLKLDHYQRPYVWGRKKIDQLLADLAEFSAQGKEQDYYLGTLLLQLRSRPMVEDGTCRAGESGGRHVRQSELRLQTDYAEMACHCGEAERTLPGV